MIFNNPPDILDFYIKNYVFDGDVVVDATVGNGYDTKKLSEAVGTAGKVIGFDIQKDALDNARKLLKDKSNVELIYDSHTEIDGYIKEKIKCAVFNLGYLPGGDHRISTQSETTITAIEKCLKILDDKGFIALTIYHGGDTGFTEKEKVLSYLEGLNCRVYGVMTFYYHNRPKNPPIFTIIEKR